MGQRGQSVQIPHEARRPPAGCLLAWTGDRHRRPPSAAGAENACRAPTAGLALLYRPTAGGVPMFGDLIFRQLFDAASSTYTYLLADPQSRQGVIIDTVFEQHWRDLALVRELNIRLVAVLDTHCHADHVTGAWLMREATGCRIGISGRSGDALLIRGAGRCDFQQGNAATLYRSITEQIFSLPDDCLVLPGHDYSGRTMSSVGEERAYNPRIGGAADERDFVGFMENLNLPHPKQLAIALPANLRSGRPEDGKAPSPTEWGPVRQSYAGLLEIDPDWVAEHQAEVHMLDVRQPEELAEKLGHIAGAQCIPLNQLKDRLAEVPRDRPVVSVCHAGMRSGQATVILRQAGFPRVANLRGGMLLWQQLGLPVEH